MITTTYKCDNCGHEQKTREQMWDIGVSLRPNGGYPGLLSSGPPSPYEKPKPEELWCRECVEKLGLLPANGGAPKEDTEPEPPTLEDMIRQIVRGETFP